MYTCNYPITKHCWACVFDWLNLASLPDCWRDLSPARKWVKDGEMSVRDWEVYSDTFASNTNSSRIPSFIIPTLDGGVYLRQEVSKNMRKRREAIVTLSRQCRGFTEQETCISYAYYKGENVFHSVNEGFVISNWSVVKFEVWYYWFLKRVVVSVCLFQDAIKEKRRRGTDHELCLGVPTIQMHVKTCRMRWIQGECRCRRLKQEERREQKVRLVYHEVEPPDKVESCKSKPSNKDYACVVNLQASNQQQVRWALPCVMWWDEVEDKRSAQNRPIFGLNAQRTPAQVLSHSIPNFPLILLLLPLVSLRSFLSLVSTILSGKTCTLTY